jgi:hypothetical protein
MVCLAFMIGGIVVFTIGFETGTEKIEHRLKLQPAYYQMLFKTYKELMIMGVISFGLTVSHELGIHFEHDMFICFEFAHILIFFVAVLFVGNAIVSSLSMERTRAVWDRLSSETLEDAIKNVKTHKEVAEASKVKDFWWNLPGPTSGWRGDCDFKIVRLMFLRNCTLPMSFDYTSYIRAKLMEIVKEVVEIGAKTWGIILSICLFVIFGTLITRFISPPVAGDGAAHRRMDEETDDDSNSTGVSGRMSAAMVSTITFSGTPDLTPAQAVANTFINMGTGWALLFCQIGLLVFIVNKKGDLIDSDMQRVLGLSAEQMPPRRSTEMGGLLLHYMQKLYDETTKQSVDMVEQSSSKAEHADMTYKTASAMVRSRMQIEKKDVTNMARNDPAEGIVHKESHVEGAVSHEMLEKIEFYNQALSLLNCFYMAFYLIHVRPNIKMAELPIPSLLHIFLIVPCISIVFWASPTTAKEHALLATLSGEDVDLVNEIFFGMDEVIEMRTHLKLGLIDAAKTFMLEEGAEGGGAEEEIDVREAAKHLFERMDTDQGGTMSHKEFRIGLEEFGMGLKKKDANKMLRSIDVDQCGEIDMEEWVAFFEMSEDDLRGRTIALANPTYDLELSLPDISELLHTDTGSPRSRSQELKEGDNKFMNPLVDIDAIEAGEISPVGDGETFPVGDGETSPVGEEEHKKLTPVDVE